MGPKHQGQEADQDYQGTRQLKKNPADFFTKLMTNAEFLQDQ
jgi:hypothetical protein